MVMFLVQLVIILVCIFIGARMGGLGLGVMGGIGLAILTFVFGVQPASPPIDVMLIIAGGGHGGERAAGFRGYGTTCPPR